MIQQIDNFSVPNKKYVFVAQFEEIGSPLISPQERILVWKICYLESSIEESVRGVEKCESREGGCEK